MTVKFCDTNIINRISVEKCLHSENKYMKEQNRLNIVKYEMKISIYCISISTIKIILLKTDRYKIIIVQTIDFKIDMAM